ncbi:MAG: PorV/PorQ family protein [Candidatus Cloacimonetes bacterium]|nr:PorV/PorQ family protein [Candidatus Cloacimonadota bacterium]MDD4687093.1 PorV/PorQ family protein [Candidatus Cloacimonadota bacterium]
MKWKIILTLFLLSVIVPMLAQNEKAGSTGFDTLKLVYGARTAAMAGTGIGIPGNHEAMNLNPATSLRAPDHGLSTTFLDHFVGSAGGGINYVYPKNIYEAWAMSLSYWNSGSIDRTEISGTGELIETGETFGASSMILGISTARFISPALDIGGSLKMIYDSIDSKSASAVMVDLGILHHTANPKIKVGASIRNLGFQTTYYTDTEYKEQLPLNYGAGISMQMNDKLLGALDINKAIGENILVKLGLEYLINKAFSLRAGIKSNARDYNVGGTMGLTGGGSLGIGWKVRNFNLDYAVVSYGDLGLTNQLSLRYNFGN